MAKNSIMETQKFCLKLEFCVLGTLIKILMGSGHIVTRELMRGGLLPAAGSSGSSLSGPSGVQRWSVLGYRGS